MKADVEDKIAYLYPRIYPPLRPCATAHASCNIRNGEKEGKII